MECDIPTLQIADTVSGTADVTLGNVGRSLHKIPFQKAFSMVHKVSDNEWWIKRVEFPNRDVTSLTKTLPGSEDYAWTPDGSFIMAQGTNLHFWTADDGWREMADLSGAGLGTITRIAVDREGSLLAFVANRK